MHTYLRLATILAHAASFALSAPSARSPSVSDTWTDGTVPASVLSDSPLIKGGPVSPISQAEIDSYIPYEWFAQAAYCPSVSKANWTCSSCQADPIKDFQVYASGGDGGKVQYWYVGWWPSKESIVVGHQGTDFSEPAAVLTDLLLAPTPLNRDLFPGAPKEATAHVGFQLAHKNTAAAVLDTVKKIIAEKGATKVVTVGHSLGGALALLDALYLRLNLPSEIAVAARTIGQPRVGNDAFARFVDEKITDLARIINKRDVIPVVPPILLGYRHTSGEKHINKDNTWNACSGHDNLNKHCSIGQILTEGISWQEHFGPYPGGIMLGAGSCI